MPNPPSARKHAKTEIGNFAFFPSGYPHNKCQDLKNKWLLKNEKIVKISY